MKFSLSKTDQLRLLSAIIAFIVCVNMGDSSKNGTTDSNDGPEVIFCGKVIDTSGNEFEADRIEISQKYKRIRVYSRPCAVDIDPSINATYIDLIELMHEGADSKNSIEVKDPGKLENFKGDTLFSNLLLFSFKL